MAIETTKQLVLIKTQDKSWLFGQSGYVWSILGLSAWELVGVELDRQVQRQGDELRRDLELKSPGLKTFKNA